jgi:hypothetical protein
VFVHKALIKCAPLQQEASITPSAPLQPWFLQLATLQFMQLFGFGAPTSRTQHLELEALMQTTPSCLELGGHVTSKERSWVCCCTKQKVATIEYSTSLVWIHHFFANQLASANIPHLYQTTLVVVT